MLVCGIGERVRGTGNFGDPGFDFPLHSSTKFVFSREFFKSLTTVCVFNRMTKKKVLLKHLLLL